MKIEVKTNLAPQAIGPYSQAIISNGFLFASGQIPIHPDSGLLCNGNIEEQTSLVMTNILGILKASDLDFSDIVKTTIFIKNMDDFSKINEIYSSYFNNILPPARETVEVSRLPKDVLIEISFIATIK